MKVDGREAEVEDIWSLRTIVGAEDHTSPECSGVEKIASEVLSQMSVS